MTRGGRPAWLHLPAALAAFFIAVSAAPSQDANPEAKAAFEMFREVAERVTARAYKPEPPRMICTRALHGLVAQLGESAKAHDRDLSALTDAAAQVEFEKEMLALAALPGQRQGLRDLVESAIQAWCVQHDPYTRYIRGADYAQIRRLVTTSGSGVGMSVEEKNGAIFCYPVPGSPAEVAGIKNADQLLAVEGMETAGKPIQLVGAYIRGAPGSQVQLRVRHNFGREQTMKITREPLTTPNVRVDALTTSLRVTIRKFTAEVVKEVRGALAQAAPGTTLTIDLRGNDGGQLEPAIELASLFMSPGETIVTLRERDKPDDVRTAQKPREFKFPAIILNQDEGTASASEMFIAALVGSESNRAVSRGPKTYGKGVFQAVMDLTHGGALILTTGELIAPQGRSWEGTGLLSSLENHRRIFPKD
jgi:carboxyl-terminal processing protease